jgi:hypothetical protein
MANSLQVEVDRSLDRLEEEDAYERWKENNQIVEVVADNAYYGVELEEALGRLGVEVAYRDEVTFLRQGPDVASWKVVAEAPTEVEDQTIYRATLHLPRVVCPVCNLSNHEIVESEHPKDGVLLVALKCVGCSTLITCDVSW